MSLLDKAKETAKKGTDKAKSAVEAGQGKIEESKLKRKVSDLKEELGGIVYAQKQGTAADNADAEVIRIVGEITDTEAEIAKLADD